MRTLKEILGFGSPATEHTAPTNLENIALPDHQRDKLERDMMILEDEYGIKDKRLHRAAEKQVQEAAEDSLKELHVIQMGVCPRCGEHLHEHLFAKICAACGWHTFETPHHGPVRVHLRHNNGIIEGERSYVVATGDVFVMRHDVVIAQIPKESVSWIEYVWTEKDVAKQYQIIINRMKIVCGWCGKTVDPAAEGFSLAQIAFGSSQERYVFCSRECYEAFRKMYPSRVHRNCYETKCSECDLCAKRYDDENDTVRMIAKDLLKTQNNKKSNSD